MLDAWIAEKTGASAPLTREALEVWQLQMLNRTLAHARRHSPFYAARLPERPLGALEELAQLPFTTPDELRRQGTRLLCVRADAVSRIVTQFTSGTTGSPKRVYFTREDQALTVDFFHHGMATLTAPGDKVLLLLPGESPGSLNDLLAQGLNRAGAEGILFGYPTPERYGALCSDILAHGAASLVGPADAIAGAAEWSRANGCDRAVAQCLRSVLLAAAHVSLQAVGAISNAWHCRIDEHYGMTETGFLGPVSCAAHAGYHLPAADLYCEIIDPNTLRPVPPGTWGEVVFTTLTRVGMPLIRYRTGDRSRLLTGVCACGSILPRLDRVQSRPQPKKFDRPGAVTF